MPNMTLARAVAFGSVLFLLSFTFITPAASRLTQSQNDLVVHEWGTFTSVRNKDGQAVLWRPLSFESDLPSFVYSVDAGKSWKGNWNGNLRYPSKSSRAVTVRMETPVLYFYAKQEMDATVKVGFSGGTITEWYPQASTTGDGVDWGKLKITPDLRVELAHDAKANHYYAARETDAAVLAVPGEKTTQYEKFLFYRGVGDFSLPVSLSIQGDRVVIRNRSREGATRAILFENRLGQIGFSVNDLGPGETVVERPALGKNIADLRQELKAMLVADGLFQREADAMLNTWHDSWFEEGLRIFYLMPRKDTDAILPLAIDPQPTSLVRVLVGRTELITPEEEKNVSAQLRKLNDPSLAVRTAARKEINRYGRFVESILKQISSVSTDPQIRTAADQFIQKMN